MTKNSKKADYNQIDSRNETDSDTYYPGKKIVVVRARNGEEEGIHTR
jgi:hypothetical protein